MVRSSPKNPTLADAKREYETALRNLRGAYHREVLTAFSTLIDNAFSQRDLKKVEQYKSLVDYLVENQGNPQAYNELERTIEKASETKQETEPEKLVEKEETSEYATRKRRRFKRRYWDIKESINAIREADLKKWGKERTNGAYYQKLKYIEEQRKATVLYKDGKLARLCIADIKNLIPDLVRNPPR